MATPAAEVDVGVPLVRALLVDQHPDLADLPLRIVANGWDNVVLRLGDDLAVRVPRRAAAAELVEHEQRWLPELAPLVAPVRVPLPVRTGRPALGYPWSWSVVPWFPGTVAGSRPGPGGIRLASALAGFLRRLHVPAPSDAPVNPVRAVPLASRSDAVLTRLATEDVARAVEAAALWRTAAAAPAYTGPPVWVHGDLHPFNVLVDPSPDGDDRLAAVVDFGDVTAGDPAVDLAAAWLVLGREARGAFRTSLAVDDATWTRARGWAVSVVVGAPHHRRRRLPEGRPTGPGRSAGRLTRPGLIVPTPSVHVKIGGADMTLEFRVQHDVATDASPVPSTPDRTGLRRLLDRLAARRAAARVRRTEARLAELTDLQRLLTAAREVIERGWIQHAWFAYVDEHGRTRKASSAAAMDVQGRPLVGACLVGSIVSAAGGPHAVHSQPVQRALDVVWHALAADEGQPVLWCPAPDVRMGRVRDLTTWNDAPARTSAEVAGLLLTAERVAVAESERIRERAVARSRA